MANHCYSVLLPVYGKDSPAYLRIAIDSMLAQTLPPEEILIAVDGPINNDLMTVISQYRTARPEVFSLHQSPNREGLGALLRKAVPLCRNAYIARMDADDYSSPERLSKQFAILDRHDDVDIVGCNVDEFMDDMTEPISHVMLPETPEDTLRFAKRRCPMRHPALLYRKDDVLASGNYAPLYTFEDYDLIVRMLHRGLRLYNIQEPLVSMRVSPDFYARRGGLRFTACMIQTKWRFLVMGFSSPLDFLISCLGQTFVSLMPGPFRAWFYKTFLRKKAAA